MSKKKRRDVLFVTVSIYLSDAALSEISIPTTGIGYLLSWSINTPDIPHIPYSEWPKCIPNMDIG
jgi:hypothetical protein